MIHVFIGGASVGESFRQRIGADCYTESVVDAIHDTVHEMCKDEARHGKAFLGLLQRYFG